MSEPIENKRIFNGQIKLCGTLNSKLYKVQLKLLNGTKCANGWAFENIENHLRDFADIPILYSVINGKVANSHDWVNVRDPKTGKTYPSFIDADCEHPAGWIKEIENGELNPHIENIDGVDWVVATGYLWAWYNRELIDEIERNGGQMSISIEALATKSRTENGVEYQEEYTIIGVTILGTGVAPAYAGANIKKLSASIDELEQLKIRAASYEQVDNTEPQTQNNENSKKQGANSMKLKIKDLVEKFPGYTVLTASGENVALLSEKGDFFLSTAHVDKNEIICGSKDEVSPVVVLANGDGSVKLEIPVTTITESLQTRCANLQRDFNDADEKRKKAEEKLLAMQAAEQTRRGNAVTAAIKNRLAEINALRPADSKFEENICESLLTAASIEKFAKMENPEGVFIGEEEARKSVDTLCMSAQLVQQKEQAKVKAAAAENRFAWEPNAGDNQQQGSTGVLSALERLD